MRVLCVVVRWDEKGRLTESYLLLYQPLLAPNFIVTVYGPTFEVASVKLLRYAS
jgi:hypothetical protein